MQKRVKQREMFGKEDEDLDNLTKFLEKDYVEEEDTLESLLDDLKKEKRNSIDDLLAEIDELSVDSSHKREEEPKQKVVKKHSTDVSKINAVDKLLAETDIEENVDFKEEENDVSCTQGYERSHRTGFETIRFEHVEIMSTST